MVPLLFSVDAESRGVPCADLGFFISGEFSLKVLEAVCLFFHNGHEALVAVGQRGVVKHQLV